MTEHAPERIWSSIDIPKTIAGTLAAVSAAVVGSFLGVAGTLVGAAVASIVGSVGTEIYQRWINRGSQKIKTTFVTAPAAVGTPPVAAAEEESPSDEPPAPPRNIRWGRVATVAGALFVLAMGLLTAAELISHKSVADAVGNKSSGTTTVGSLLGGDGEKKNNKPAVTPSDSTSPSEEPSGEPGTTPSESPSPSSTTEPSEAPTSEAPSEAPEQTTPPATEGDTGGDTSGDGGSGVEEVPPTRGAQAPSGTGSE